MIKEKQKEVYTSPTTEVLVVRVEGVICSSIDGGVSGNGFGSTPNADIQDLSNENWW